MPQDAFTLLAVTRELNNKLKGAKINRVSQPDRDDVYLLTYSQLGTKTLVLSTNAQTCRIGFTSREKPNPKVAYNFCMLLRKHLLGATIDEISLIGFERIVRIDFSGRNDFRETVKKTLYLEVMGKYSNLILTENGIIAGCLKNAPLDVATTRVTLSGAEYKLPKPQDKADIFDREETVKRLSLFSGGDFADFVFNNLKGIAYPTAAEIAERCYVDGDVQKTYERIYNFVNDPDVNPCVSGEGKTKDFYVFKYSATLPPTVFYDSITDAQDAFYSEKEAGKEFSFKQKQLLDKVNGLIKKYAKRLQGESEKLLSAENYDLLRIKGELITANLYKLKQGESECVLENYYDDYKPLKITLDKNLTPNANAQKYFKKYAKEKRTVEIIIPQKEQTEKELSYLRSVSFEIAAAKDITDFGDIEDELISAGILPAPKFKKKKTEESPYRTYLIGGYVVKCGKNNVQNDRLTSRAFKDDMWLHAKNFHSSHVIIETKGDKIPDDVIRQAAEICAYYSDAREGSKVPVDYALKKFVKKPPKAKPGSVVYTDYKTCLVSPSSHEEFIK